ncbi:MFS transporter [Martelella alba]|uniref:MFS transporter n=1 Tax=Martelella alba TaxID=2590451 RepID=A0ABY2SQJ1_9HYPH|nr:MFS transporter [Martelella alba]TKI08489.1 MFS transporter [Martelella alba]
MKNVLSSFNMTVFAIAVGVLVANLYYAQPLLSEIALDLGVNAGQSGFLVTLSQLGYAGGVFFIVPLGDRTDRRNLISYMLVLCTVALLGATISPTLLTLSIASLVSGITSSATMVIIPYVASHSDENTRGKSVGQVMTGLLLGILLARTVSGIIAELLSWRWMYFIAATAVALLAVLLRRIMIKDESHEVSLSYGKLLISLGQLFRDESEIRWRGWFTLLGLGSFSVLWTGLTFLLSNPPYNYNTATIGLFGLIGGAGALSAN